MPFCVLSQIKRGTQIVIMGLLYKANSDDQTVFIKE